MLGFERKRSANDIINSSFIGLERELDPKQEDRLRRIKTAWNFYEGYHWEDFPLQSDSAELTVNYCRAFVDKFVSFELGKSFTFGINKQMEQDIVVTNDGRTLFQYLEDVWEDNNQYSLGIDLGQMKSVTGEAWLQVRFDTPEEIKDPFAEYPDGRVRIILHPTSIIFPEFNPHDRDQLDKITIMYTYEEEVKTPILGRVRKERKTFKQIWTSEEVITQYGKDEPETVPNRYSVIPFVQIKNLTLAGRTEGRGDLDDLIPINVEYNIKNSNVSEILDYHAAPVTVVYGAKIGNLEKGANKVWGGLSKDARVENLELKEDMGGSAQYINTLRLAMCEVGGIPETVLGGAQAISNTSGVALQYINLPLIEKTRLKRMNTETGLEYLNKLIIFVSISEGLVRKPDNIPMRDFLQTEVTLPDTLPKDVLLELQQLEIEMRMGVESRKGAMTRLGREDIDARISEIDTDRAAHPDVYGMDTTNLNSGMTNGETAAEQIRTELTGQNGGAE